MSGEDETEWEDHIDMALLAIRTSHNRATDRTPFFLTYGTEARLGCDVGPLGVVEERSRGAEL